MAQPPLHIPTLTPLVGPPSGYATTPVPMHMLPNAPFDQPPVLGAPIVLTNPAAGVQATLPKPGRKPGKRKTQTTSAAADGGGGAGGEAKAPRKPSRVRTPGEAAAASARKKPDISLGLRVWPAALGPVNASIPDGPVIYERCMEPVANGGMVVLKQVQPFATPIVTVYPKAFPEQDANSAYTLLEQKSAWSKPVKPASESRTVCLWSKDGKEYLGKQGGIPTVPFSDILTYVQSQVGQYNDQAKESNLVVGHRLQTENKERNGKSDALADQTVDSKELVAGTDFHIVAFGQSRILTLHPKTKPKAKKPKEAAPAAGAPPVVPAAPEAKVARQPARPPLLKLELKHGSYVRLHSAAFTTSGVTLAYAVPTTLTDLDIKSEFLNAIVLMGRTLAPPVPKPVAAPVVPAAQPIVAAALPGIPTPTVPIAMPPLEQAVPMMMAPAVAATA